MSSLIEEKEVCETFEIEPKDVGPFYEFLAALELSEDRLKEYKDALSIKQGKTIYLSRNVTHKRELCRNACLLGRFDQADLLFRIFENYSDIPYVMQFMIDNHRLEKFLEIFANKINYMEVIEFANSVTNCHLAFWLGEQEIPYIREKIYEYFGCVPSIVDVIHMEQSKVKVDTEFMKKALEKNLLSAVGEMINDKKRKKFYNDVIIETYIEGNLSTAMINMLIKAEIDVYDTSDFLDI